MRDGKGRSRWRVLIAMLCVVFVATGCSGAAAQRLKDASRVIALRVGSSADDVERTFKTRFTTLTEAQLADEAEGAVQRTSWIDNALARVAADRVKTAKAVQRSTCRVLDGYALLSQLSEADRSTEIVSIVVGELETQGLSADEASIRSVYGAVKTQIDSLQATGSPDVQSMASDLFCTFPL
jgi:hypothetical protein